MRTMGSLLFMILALWALLGSVAAFQRKGYNGQPNFIFIITDDQDHQMDSLSYMPYVKKHLIDEGTLYKHHYCTVALCCPSRVNLWTGRAAHNTNVTDLRPPFGGYPKFVKEGLNEAWLPVWLQDSGYKTYYTGKLMNSHNTKNYDKPFPAGWDGADFLVEPGTYSYMNPIFQRNKNPPNAYTDQYNTDLVAGKAFGFLSDGVRSGKPFFLAIAPVAPHADLEFLPGGGLRVHPPVPAKQFENLFPEAVVPRTPNFNPPTPHGAAWISHLPQQNDTNVAWNDEFYRSRLRSLQTVDEMVAQLISQLDAYGILDKTYVFYTSDNGYHIGQHRLQPGKSCAFEEDINVPLILRGPSVPRGVIADVVTSHTDLVPTILELAGAQARPELDGASIPTTAQSLEKAGGQEHVNVEFWGHASAEGKYNAGVFNNNTYKSLRIIGKDYSFLYSVWCSGEHELYDMVNDPYQTTNIYHADSEFLTIASTATPKQQLIPRLDALLLVLKTCKQQSCVKPWNELHPEGDVRTLSEALRNEYDDFYDRQHKVSFSRCYGGQVLEHEGPLEAIAYHPLWSQMG